MRKIKMRLARSDKSGNRTEGMPGRSVYLGNPFPIDDGGGPDNIGCSGGPDSPKFASALVIEAEVDAWDAEAGDLDEQLPQPDERYLCVHDSLFIPMVFPRK